ncbi:hypothetical protein BH11CYA1_BH11CYA1_40480 [soil metagenome]
MPLFLRLLLLLTFSSVPQIAMADELSAIPNASAKVVPKTLQAGATFDDRNLPQQAINGWYRIPAWFAGATIRTETVAPDGRVEKSVRRRERGRQLDARGQIWEAKREPIMYDIDEEKMVVHTILEEEVPISATTTHIVMAYYFLMVCERKKDRVIQDSYRTVQIHSFAPGPDGSIFAQIEKSVYFKPDGSVRNVLINPASYIEHKTRAFAPLDSDDKFNYKDSFIEFLERSNHPELIPQS